jgi:hypothetical protein
MQQHSPLPRACESFTEALCDSIRFHEYESSNAIVCVSRRIDVAHAVIEQSPTRVYARHRVVFRALLGSSAVDGIYSLPV